MDVRIGSVGITNVEIFVASVLQVRSAQRMESAVHRIVKARNAEMMVVEAVAVRVLITMYVVMVSV